MLGEPSNGAKMFSNAQLEEVERVRKIRSTCALCGTYLAYLLFLFRAIMIMAVGIISIVSLCCYTGIVIYAAFYDCDPVTTKVTNSSAKKYLISE